MIDREINNIKHEARSRMTNTKEWEDIKQNDKHGDKQHQALRQMQKDKDKVMGRH